MSPVSNKVSSVKRLSALAQLIQKWAEEGITSTAELTKITGYSDRAIRLAKAEAGFRVRAATGFGAEAGFRQPASASGSRLPPPSRARIESTLRVDTSFEEREEKKERAHESLNLRTKNDSLPSISSVPESLPTPQSPPPVFRGKALVVSADQHAEWRAMWPDYDLRLGYPIADADCVEKGKAGDAAVICAQRKLGYLASDWKQREPKRSPEEERLARIDAALRARDPENYVNGMMS